MDDKGKRKWTGKANYNKTEVKKIRPMKDILKETDTAHYIDTITSQKNVNTNKQQQKLYSNLKKEIQYQISQTRKETIHY